MKRKIQNSKFKTCVSRFTFHEKGIVIYLALITLSAALATALFIAGAFVKEFKISRDLVNSLNAVYVADSIMEQALYNVRVPAIAAPINTIAVTSCTSSIVPNALVNAGCLYSITTNSTVGIGAIPLCSSANANVGTATDCTQIIAKGAYGNTNRAIEIVYGNL